MQHPVWRGVPDSKDESCRLTAARFMRILVRANVTESRGDSMKYRRSPFDAVLLGCVLVAWGGEPCWSQSPPTNIGSQACKECHEDQWNHFQSNPHTRAEMDAKLVGDVVGCESCHGPGSAHAEAAGDSSNPGFATIRNFKKAPAMEANQACITCHNGGEQAFWSQAEHAKRDVKCIECHSVHNPKSPGGAGLLTAKDASQLCLKCHVDKQIAMARTAHMPLREGGMSCVDCHNPHGSVSPHNLRAQTTSELCISCHADKRGPMLWEHAPVREDCLNCHDPHGSNNPQVLAGKLPFLCQRCHITTRHPSTLYDSPDLGSNRLFNRSCVNCHSQIHGSNHPSGKFFLR